MLERSASLTRRLGALAGALCALGPFVPTARAQDAAGPLLRDASFEELAGLTISTVSHRPESSFAAPAATTVLTNEMVTDSGALSLPEALREVPGLNVAQISTDVWAVGARGFQWQFANKLLVMVDGRSIYSPTLGGVPWEDHPVFLEDLDRVEVVRGPGSSIWGANAVNGVINVLTRSAFDTVGTRVTGGVGGFGTAFLGFREGWMLAPNLAVRVFAQHDEHGDNRLVAGGSAGDGYRRNFGGLRLDWKPAPGDTVTLQAEGHHRDSGYVRTLPSVAAPPTYSFVDATTVTGSSANVAASWRHELPDGAQVETKAYWDRLVTDRPLFRERVATVDFSSVYTSATNGLNLFSTGVGWRTVDAAFDNRLFAFVPPTSRTGWFNAFIHYERALPAANLRLTVGTKVEHHDESGWNLQPTVRLAWTPSPDWTAWASVGRAVRVPDLSEIAVDADVAVLPPGAVIPGVPAVVRILGNPAVASEKLLAAEVGVRWKAVHGFSADLALFSYRYTDYVLATAGAPTFDPGGFLVLPNSFTNGINGESYGGEVALNWDPTPRLRLALSQSLVQIELHTVLPDVLGYERDEDTTPHNTTRLTATWRPEARWELRVAARHVDPVGYYDVPGYAEIDAQVSYRPDDRWELALGGRNLLHGAHQEYDSAILRRPTALGRTLLFTSRWKY